MGRERGRGRRREGGLTSGVYEGCEGGGREEEGLVPDWIKCSLTGLSPEVCL